MLEIPHNMSAETESDTDGEFVGSTELADSSDVKLPAEQSKTAALNRGPTFARTPSALPPTAPKSAHEPFFSTLSASVRRIASASSDLATAGMRSDKEKEKKKEKEGAEKRKQESLDYLLNNNSTNASSSFSTSSRSLSHRFRSLSTPILFANVALQNAVPHSNLSPKRLKTSNGLIGFSPRRLQNHASLSSLMTLNNKSLIATAKNLLEQLEFMWAELSNTSETPPASPSRTPSPSTLHQQNNQFCSKSDANSSSSETLIPEEETSNTNNCKVNNVNSIEVEEIDAGFFSEKKQLHLAFFKKPKAANFNASNNSISSNYSEVVQESAATSDKKVTSGGGINFKILEALKKKDNSDKVADHKALLPIIANLEKLVGDESSRRSAVVQNIKNLHDQLFSACERLCVPIDKFINPQNFPPNATIYAKRDILLSRIANVECTLKTREERLLGLKEAVAESRKVLEEDGQTDNRFEITVKDDLSVATVDAWVELLCKLEEEKSLRQTAICKCCAKIYTTATMLNKFPSETDQEKNLTEFLQTPLVISTTTVQKDSSSQDELTTAPQRQSLKEQQQRLQEHYICLLDRHDDQPGFSLSLTKSCIAWLETVLVQLESNLSQRREQCVRYVKEIQMCLDELGGEECENFHLDSDNLERLDEVCLI
ncbi:hypothetical protein HK100_001622 [Physocladia obscura]|uniref:Uncharacterized protein n=1 Tax=Physocladia obscura TaxID=109957 RepID=A0AAD5XAX2_9FUNG|nr:hypothetical protein HK100_001622 [Physocladia obscura]